MHYESMFCIKPGGKLRLKDIDPDYKGHHETEQDAVAEIEHNRQKMAHMQSLLYAEKKRSVLVILQTLDAGAGEFVRCQRRAVARHMGMHPPAENEDPGTRAVPIGPAATAPTRP